VGQHDVSFVSRKSDGYDSTARSQHHDRIAAGSSHRVGTSCAASAVRESVKYQEVHDTDEESDQCQVQSQCFMLCHVCNAY